MREAFSSWSLSSPQPGQTLINCASASNASVWPQRQHSLVVFAHSTLLVTANMFVITEARRPGEAMRWL
jgi:hypothetical protein